jgi:hypothetical protein
MVGPPIALITSEGAIPEAPCSFFCAKEESSNPVVRHEVPLDRVEVQGLHRRLVAAGR